MEKIRNTENKIRDKFIFYREGQEQEEPKMWMTSWDVFKCYRYRKQYSRVNPKTGKLMIYQPYIKTAESSNHEFALIFPEWEKIIQTYFNVMIEALTKADTVKFPRDMGYLQMCRVKKNINSERSKRSKMPKFLNLATMGFKPKVIWIRRHEMNFANKMWFRFLFSRKYQMSHVGRELKRDPSIVYNWDNLT